VKEEEDARILTCNYDVSFCDSDFRKRRSLRFGIGVAKGVPSRTIRMENFDPVAIFFFRRLALHTRIWIGAFRGPAFLRNQPCARPVS
jgi:hypothetical protein